MQSIVITVISPDRPGLVKQLSDVIVKHQGSWGQSSMANLAGQFAGIMQINVADEHLVSLQQDLVALAQSDITVSICGADTAIDKHIPVINIAITAHDKPGIVQEVAGVCTQLGVNLISLETDVNSGSMSGEPMFTATAQAQLLNDVDSDTLLDALEALSDDLMVDVE